MNPAYEIISVTYSSGNSVIAGRLFVPANQTANCPRPAITILGPFSLNKEQVSIQYATRLAKEGFVTLIYDPTYFGESDGKPRRYDCPQAKIADISASLDFLHRRPEVNKNAIIAMGICQGASESIAAAAKDKRIKALVAVSGRYICPEYLNEFYKNGGPSLEDRITKGNKAKAKYLRFGIVDYGQITDSVRKDVALPYRHFFDWYKKWDFEKTTWSNRYAVMSDADLLTFDVKDYARKISVPTLIIHGEASEGDMSIVQRIHESISRTSKKKLCYIRNVYHTQFYDDPIVVDKSVDTVTEFLRNFFK